MKMEIRVSETSVTDYSFALIHSDDLNRNSIDVTECLDWTKWPEPDAEICCEEMVWWGAVDNCVSGVQWGCYEPCFSHFDWPWSAIESGRDKCDCYYGTGRRNGKVGTREECEAIGQSTGLFTVDLTGFVAYIS